MASVFSASQVLPPPRPSGSRTPLVHPGVWRASQISRGEGQCLDTGHPGLSAQLPGQGWPCGALIELLVGQPGVGELALLQPALATVAQAGSVVLIQPPHVPNAVAWAGWRLDPARLLWVRPQTLADALWAADQALKSGSCGAVMCWLPQVPVNALRRLHTVAQGGNALFVVLRPAQAAHQASPAPLRLALQPAAGGVQVHFIKRRGPLRELPLHVPLSVASFSVPVSSHALMDGDSSLPDEPGRLAGVTAP